MRDVLKNLIDGMSEAWVKVGKYWRVPCKSAITQARQRLGAGVMSRLFHQLVQPMATGETLGAFLNGHQIHHRGQVHAMLAETRVKPPQLDEFFMRGDAPYRAEDLMLLSFSEADITP